MSWLQLHLESFCAKHHYIIPPMLLIIHQYAKYFDIISYFWFCVELVCLWIIFSFFVYSVYYLFFLLNFLFLSKSKYSWTSTWSKILLLKWNYSKEQELIRRKEQQNLIYPMVCLTVCSNTCLGIHRWSPRTPGWHLVRTWSNNNKNNIIINNN